MPHKLDSLAKILKNRIVAVVRADDGSMLVDIAEALVAGGIDIVEATFTTPMAHRVLETMADRLGDRILLGAGTVLDSETARIAILSGADFVVSPTVDLGVIELCRRYDKVVIPGALTPTEMLTAWQAGADLVKLFPSDLTGPGYIKTVHGPLPQVRIIPSGGVTLENAADFLRAGACAVGAAGSLIEPEAIKTGDMKRIETMAKKFVAAIAGVA
jgi:2-dehydro-3-deoxyphosphogluconate aldolase/(4S)-4-hydroxy-2-oxoglutarate aldolase